jgi:serine/threonine-protein kinase RsbW
MPRRAHVSAATVAQVADAFDAFCAGERLPSHATWPLRVALDEIVSNILVHGGTRGRVPVIDVLFRRDAGGIEVVVADDGPPFDPTARQDPDVTLALDARQPGGLGITLVKSLVDRVGYERRAFARDDELGSSHGPEAHAEGLGGTPRVEANVLTMWKAMEPDAGSGGSE